MPALYLAQADLSPTFVPRGMLIYAETLIPRPFLLCYSLRSAPCTNLSKLFSAEFRVRADSNAI